MANLKEVKGRIQSVTSTQQITKAMKMVAAAKLRRAQDRIMQMRPYAEKLDGVMQNVSSAVDTQAVDNPYGQERDVGAVLLVVISSDRGLCGAFNSNIFKYTRNLIADKYSHIEASGNLHILPIGKRAYEYYKKRGYSIIDTYYDLFNSLDFDHVRVAAEHAMKSFVSQEFDQIEIIYNEFKNVATQIIRNEQFLPILSAEPSEGKNAQNIDFIAEPNEAFIFNEIIPKSLKIQFYKGLLESNASEHGARMTAMGQATDNAGELLKELKLTYNRTRQAAITKEILEIVGGAEALAKES
ncbi:MAG: ATP synthase F1 subunit gamma [Flammeovirgaceae bacterium]|nr:ATP synthase F1 subunit gamma [Flammeovirgaceae bacterium]